jgi:hypothetical protein
MRAAEKGGFCPHMLPLLWRVLRGLCVTAAVAVTS